MMHSVVPYELLFYQQAGCLNGSDDVLLCIDTHNERQPQAILSTNPRDFLNQDFLNRQ